MKTQKGMTLIELMIVIAIIGILASFGIVWYMDYLTRAKVGEAFGLFAGIRTPLLIEYNVEGKFPDSLSQLNVATSGQYVEDMVVENPDANVIKITMRDDWDGNEDYGQDIYIVFSEEENQFKLGSNHTASSGGSGGSNLVALRYIPSAWRQQN